MTGTVQKNGNISQMQWRTRGRERQGYRFTYDFLDRMTDANYFDITDAGTATASSRYNESLTYADKRGNIATLQRQGTAPSGSCITFGQIDNLNYAYTAGTNKISGITEGVTSTTYKAKGFNPGAGTGSYAYDVNGNMKTDPYKAMTIIYNHLNLPNLFSFAGGAQSNTIEILYDAAGTKLRKTVKTGATVNYTQDYIGGIEYRDGVREAIYTAEGRLYNNAGTNRYEYNIKDHLGNTRLSFTDKDGDGVVEVFNTSANEVLQENHYYPFGLNMDGKWMNDAILDNKYQYNGKEWNDDFGLNLNDYGARWYDASVGRWWSVDPLNNVIPSNSPFGYVSNNPIRLIDPDGMLEGAPEAFQEQYDQTMADREASRANNAENNSDSGESTIVSDNGDGTYTVVGGNPNDNDNGIYVDNCNGNQCEKIGTSSTSHSFFTEDDKPVVGAVIDMNSTEGQDFIDKEIVGANSGKGVGFVHYLRNAKGGEPLDFKNIGLKDRGLGVSVQQYQYRGSVASDGTIGSARDFGNVGAGIVAGRSGLSWRQSRLGFDGLESAQRFSQNNMRPSTEGKPTVLAQWRGFQIGQAMLRATKP